MSFLKKLKDTLPFGKDEPTETESEGESAISKVAEESESGSSVYDRGS